MQIIPEITRTVLLEVLFIIIALPLYTVFDFYIYDKTHTRQPLSMLAVLGYTQ